MNICLAFSISFLNLFIAGYDCLISKKHNLGIELPCEMSVSYNHFLIIILNDLQVMPKQPGFEERRDLYMLYHYLNHYNLFGSGYRSSAMPIIDDYLAFLKA